ncbi:MAG TPA: hypothetical protein VF501_00005 [Thiobacillus sp.]
MSQAAKNLHSGVDKMDAAPGHVSFAPPDRDISLADAVVVGTAIRPGRGRPRAKTELDEKLKKPADSVRKKTPPARKAPSRGRYVDEYARPAV